MDGGKPLLREQRPNAESLEQSSDPLAASDRKFVERARRGRKANVVFGWLAIVLALGLGGFAAFAYDDVVGVLNMREVESADKVKAIETRTELEVELVRALVQQNERIWFAVRVLILFLVLIMFINLLSNGVTRLLEAKRQGRYLRLIDQLARQAPPSHARPPS